jgi:hypothetical protein
MQTHNRIDCATGEVIHPNETYMECQAAEILCKEWPYVSWYTEANFDGGVFYVEIPEYHMDGNKNYAFVLHLDKIKGWDDFRRNVRNAGGELLERAHISTSRDYRYADKVDRD